jgi:hypothetical protein
MAHDVGNQEFSCNKFCPDKNWKELALNGKASNDLVEKDQTHKTL